MKLYYYEHCPYCVRVLAFAHAKKIPLEKVVLLNNDEKTPIQLVGKKMVPILVTPDGNAMGESLDIILFLDALGEKVLPDTIASALFDEWSVRLKPITRPLVFPRMVEYPFKEFSTASSRQYFTAKKSLMVGDFLENTEKTPDYLLLLNPLLCELEAQLCRDNSTDLMVDDLLFFPELQLLTLVHGVVWPRRLREYLEQKSLQFALPLYDH